MSARAVVIALSLLCLAPPARAGATRYEPRRAGHPLRIAAYAAHPFGVMLDTLIFHPAWWVGQHEPFRTLFGVQTQPDDGAAVRDARAEAEPAGEPGPSEPETD